MNRNFRIKLIIAGAVLAVPAAWSADVAGDAIKKCSHVLGERERLACYDRAFQPGPETSELPAAKATAPAPAAAPAAAAATKAPAAAAAAGTAAVGATAFGSEQVMTHEEKMKDDEAKTPREITAKLVDVQQFRQDTWRVTLENGQVWDQMDMTVRFQPHAGDTVKILKGKLGGYQMSVTDGQGGPWVRVTRRK